jgi:hypothetical protein
MTDDIKEDEIVKNWIVRLLGVVETLTKEIGILRERVKALEDKE